MNKEFQLAAAWIQLEQIEDLSAANLTGPKKIKRMAGTNLTVLPLIGYFCFSISLMISKPEHAEGSNKHKNGLVDILNQTRQQVKDMLQTFQISTDSQAKFTV